MAPALPRPRSYRAGRGHAVLAVVMPCWARSYRAGCGHAVPGWVIPFPSGSCPAGGEPAAEGDGDAARGRQRHAAAEDVEAARLDGAEQREVGAAHDLGREEPTGVGRRQRGPRALVVLAGAPRLEGHELD